MSNEADVEADRRYTCTLLSHTVMFDTVVFDTIDTHNYTLSSQICAVLSYMCCFSLTYALSSHTHMWPHVLFSLMCALFSHI